MDRSKMQAAMERNQRRLSLRQMKLAREQARDTLDKVLQWLWRYNPPPQAEHFKENFRKIWEQKKAERAITPAEQATLEVTNRFQQEGAYFFNILTAAVKGAIPSERDFEGLTRALNSPIQQIGFYPDRRSPLSEGPFMAKETDHPLRAAAELLLRYLNLIYDCGPMHTVCAVCDSLMTMGRGGKKFCSPECRQAYWSYSRQKEYYLERAKENRKIRNLQRKHEKQSS